MRSNFKNDEKKSVKRRTTNTVKLDDPACNVLDEIVALASQNGITISKIQALKFVLKDTIKEKVVSGIVKAKKLIDSHWVE